MIEHIVKEKITSYTMREYEERFIDIIEERLMDPKNSNNIQTMVDKTIKKSNDGFSKTNFTDKAN